MGLNDKLQDPAGSDQEQKETGASVLAARPCFPAEKKETGDLGKGTAAKFPGAGLRPNPIADTPCASTTKPAKLVLATLPN